MDAKEKLIVGWREWLALPDLGLPLIKAKVDTGARTSALHVERLERFDRDGAPWVAFFLTPGSRRRQTRAQRIEAPVIDVRDVTDSGGNRSPRPFIRTRVVIGQQTIEIEMNLTDRRAMLFPLLLGRTAIAGRYSVDPEGSYLLGRPRRKRKARA